MATPLIAPTGPLAARGTSGLLSLILLLLCAIAGAAAFTAYLLRTVVTPVIPVARPAAYAVWYRQGDAIVAVGSDGRSRTVATLPTAQLGSVEAIYVSPKGRRIVLFATRGGVDRAWLLDPPSHAPQSLPLPPAPAGRASPPWRYLAVAWAGPRALAALLGAAGPGGHPGMLARYTLSGAPGTAVSASWQRLQLGDGQIASLSPIADQVALAAVQARSGVFAPQVVVTLQHLHDVRRTVALRYLGDQAPAGVLWSPDGGTVAIPMPGQGLAIQKSSGRPVRQVADGALPAAFSERGADLAYVSGGAGHWQIHVLNLHGEADHQFPAPGGARPLWLHWTPDAQALLCLAGGALWQIEPGAGTPVRLLGTPPGLPLTAVPTS